MENKLIKELREEISGKKVLILGFGREGKLNLEAVARAGEVSKIVIADQNDINIEEARDIVTKAGSKNLDISTITGEDYLSHLDEFDIVFKSPGVVLPKPFYEYKALITSQTQYFLKVYGSQTIGVTGTKGKSTTTTLIYHELKENGFDTLLAGNIGIPAFALIDEIKEETRIVCELSCHQLEYGSYYHILPSTSMFFLNILTIMEALKNTGLRKKTFTKIKKRETGFTAEPELYQKKEGQRLNLL